ncbi:hypothetical protein BMF94_4941, partial [Rhodotorula taiwanensis]
VAQQQQRPFLKSSRLARIATLALFGSRRCCDLLVPRPSLSPPLPLQSTPAQHERRDARCARRHRHETVWVAVTRPRGHRTGIRAAAATAEYQHPRPYGIVHR